MSVHLYKKVYLLAFLPTYLHTYTSDSSDKSDSSDNRDSSDSSDGSDNSDSSDSSDGTDQKTYFTKKTFFMKFFSFQKTKKMCVPKISFTQIVTKLKDSNYDKTEAQIVTKLKN